MDTTGKFVLPPPKFKDSFVSSSAVPHFLSPEGIQLLPKEQQPPPMYGPRGSTVPPKFLSPLKVPSTTDQFDRKQKYFCDSCEAEFHTSTDYKVHRSEHVQCEIGDCSFRGHPAFMETHIAHQHATGLYDQIKKMSTPEEIAQWRLDRQKNYPTVANVEQKWKAREQRIRRGEKLEKNKNRFGKASDRRPIRGERKNFTEKVGSKRHKQRNNKTKTQGDPKVEKKNPSKQSMAKEKNLNEKANEEPTCGGVKKFEGTAGMAGFKKEKKIETNVLTSLLGMYGSDSESDTEESSSNSESENMAKSETIDSETKVKSDNVNTQSLLNQPGEGKQNLSVENFNKDSQELEPDVEMKEQSGHQKSKTDETKINDPKANKEESSDDEGPEEQAICLENKTHTIPAEMKTCIEKNEQLEAQKSRRDESALEDIATNKEEHHSTDDKGTKEQVICSENKAQINKCELAQDFEEKEQPGDKTNGGTPMEDTPAIKKDQSSDDGGPEEVAISKSNHIPDKPQPEPLRKKSKPNPPKRKSGLDYRKLSTGRQNTMLEKLLESDIRHERNVLLQCVRFVVENKFFDKPKSES